MQTTFRLCIALALAILSLHSPVLAQSRQAPPGMFKDLDDEILGDARIIHGKQLFIDDYLIGEMQGVRKQLNQPVKHPQNPLMKKEKPWEYAITYGAIVRDEREGLYKQWYQIWSDEKDSIGSIGYATSQDGLKWDRPVTDEATGKNLVRFTPDEPWAGGPGVFIDERDSDPARRFKMMYISKPNLKSSSLASHVAWSADGIHWTQAAVNPAIPFSDTQVCPFWDRRLNRYVAFLRFGPPNVRLVSRIESEDFLHWSPKLTVINKSKLDGPFSTDHYTMSALPYAGVYLGLINTYHGETIAPIPEDKLWMDRKDVQLAFSRNGVTWQRVGKEGAISAKELRADRDWQQTAKDAAFLPYGEFKKEWDWGSIVSTYHPPLVVDDEIRIYYTGINGRNWHNYHKDASDHAVGLATLRLDGFVSVNAGDEPGSLTTKPVVFLGDTLVVNANAGGGSLTVEALDADGKVIEGFGAADCMPITTDSVRHVLKWQDNADCHLLQGRPIRLRFHLKNSKLYAFTPHIKLNHYLQSYD
ncbi:MAG: hypothetical protein EXS05_15850 [Planctomycetaceae bacterium]|nr:hypothetical protein [Planctomycetaceae bacterium]